MFQSSLPVISILAITNLKLFEQCFNMKQNISIEQKTTLTQALKYCPYGCMIQTCGIEAVEI